MSDAARALSAKMMLSDYEAGLAAAAGPSEPSLPEDAAEFLAEPWQPTVDVGRTSEPSTPEGVARHIKCAQRSVGALRSLASKGLEQAKWLEGAGFASECTDELLARERRSDNGELARRLRDEHCLVQSARSRLFSCV